jgi:hypothetical protein
MKGTFGKRETSARTTVKPPSPESKTPIMRVCALPPFDRQDTKAPGWFLHKEGLSGRLRKSRETLHAVIGAHTRGVAP